MIDFLKTERPTIVSNLQLIKIDTTSVLINWDPDDISIEPNPTILSKFNPNRSNLDKLIFQNLKRSSSSSTQTQNYFIELADYGLINNFKYLPIETEILNASNWAYLNNILKKSILYYQNNFKNAQTYSIKSYKFNWINISCKCRYIYIVYLPR